MDQTSTRWKEQACWEEVEVEWGRFLKVLIQIVSMGGLNRIQGSLRPILSLCSSACQTGISASCFFVQFAFFVACQCAKSSGAFLRFLGGSHSSNSGP